MFISSVIFYFLYHVFCKKYEVKLVKQKEEETARLEENNEVQSTGYKLFPGHTENVNYWGTQIAGISKF